MPIKKQYSEAELIETFGLTRIEDNTTPLMQEWLSVKKPVFTVIEQHIFDEKLLLAHQNLFNWNEEDLKMKFISFILPLGHLIDTDKYITGFEKSITAVVNNIRLTTKTDFLVSSGRYNIHKSPYFHIQEYKPSKKPTGDSMAQLLEAMLITQVLNNNKKPIYGCEVVGKYWNFVILEQKNYYISKSYDSTDTDGLLGIIAILRNFTHILETKLLD